MAHAASAAEMKLAVKSYHIMHFLYNDVPIWCLKLFLVIEAKVLGHLASITRINGALESRAVNHQRGVV
jgi:hypothetical protein